MKKMRKLIPAFAMLMVAAIMMTTASFAWFTMNEEVTATGMQIKAKATGSLVVGKAPLGDSDKITTTVELDTTQKELKPVTWLPVDYEYGNNQKITTAGWYNGTGVNVVSGAAAGYVAIPNNEMVSGTTYFDQYVYLGSAGDTLNNQSLTIEIGSLVHLSNDIAHYAYAAAIYVVEKGTNSWNNGAAPAIDETPDAIIRVADWDNLNKVTLKGDNDEGYTIPSVVGLTKEENLVGLKVYVRVFVDGNLVNNDKTVDVYEDRFVLANSADKYNKPGSTNADVTVADTYKTFNAAYDYYTRTGNETDGYVYTPVAKGEFTATSDMSAYYVNVNFFKQTAAQYCINSTTAPTDASSLEFSFTIAQLTVNNNQQGS